MEHRGNAVDVAGDFQPAQDFVESRLQPGRHGVGALVDGLVRH